MSTDTQQLNNQESSAQTPIILEAGQRVTAKIKDIQSFVEPVNALLKPEKRLTNVVSLSEITQALIPANLNLKDEVIELNPKVGETVSTIVELDENSEYIGFNSITVRTKPLENRVIPLLTPAMLNAEGGLTITKTSDDFCGMNQVEIQDIALASNIEYTLVPSDLESTDTVEFDFLTFDKFSDEIKKQYKDKVFGAKDLTVNVPLVEEHIFYVDATNIGKTYVPADIPEDFDGTGGKEAKLGFKRVGISAVLNSTLTKDEVVAYMTDTTSTNNISVISGGNNSLGYPAIEVPPVVNIGINLANYIKATNIDNSIETFSFNPSSGEHNLNDFTDTEDAVGIYSLTLKHPKKIALDLSDLAEEFLDAPILSVADESSNTFSIDFTDIEKSTIVLPHSTELVGPGIGKNLLTQLTIPIPHTFKVEIDISKSEFSISNRSNLQLLNDLIAANEIFKLSSNSENNLIFSDFSISSGMPTTTLDFYCPPSGCTYTVMNNKIQHARNQQFIKNPFLNFEVEFKATTTEITVLPILVESDDAEIIKKVNLKTTDFVSFPKVYLDSKEGIGGIIPIIKNKTNSLFVINHSANLNIFYEFAGTFPGKTELTTNPQAPVYYEKDNSEFIIKINTEQYTYPLDIPICFYCTISE